MTARPTYQALLKRIEQLEDSGCEPEGIEDYIRGHAHRLTQILEFLPDATFMIDGCGRVLAWNRAIEELTGVGAEKMIGKGDYEYAIPFYGTRRPVMIDLVISDDDSLDHMYAYVKRDGDRFESESFIPHLKPGGAYLYNTARCLYSAEGEIVGAIESIRDITDQKRAEKALEQSRRHLEEIIDFLPDATFVIDNRGVVRMWNRAMEELTGVRAKDIIGKGNHEHAIPFYGKRRPILIDLVLHWDEKVEKEYLYLEKDGSRLALSESFHPLLGKNGIYLAGSAAPLYDADGSIVGAIESVRDISWKKHHELERENLIQDLQKTLAEVKILRGILPICSECKQIRDDSGYWNKLEQYIESHSDAALSHSICPRCADKYFRQLGAVKKSPCNPCNPCGQKNACNPCAAKNPCSGENPCSGKNPCSK